MVEEVIYMKGSSNKPSVKIMIAQRLFSVIFVWGLLWMEISGEADYENTCPKEAIVNLEDGEIRGVFVYKSGLFYPPEARWKVNGTWLLGCPCAFKVCVPLCCPFEYASNAEGDCIADELTSEMIRSPSKLFKKVHHPFISNPCKSVRKDLVSRITAFDLWPDGSLYHEASMSPLPIESYCVSRGKNSTATEAIVCHQAWDPAADVWAIVFLVVAIFFLLSTYIVFSLAPGSRNLRGWIVRSYLVSCIGFMTLLTAWIFMFRFGLASKLWAALTIGIGIIYFDFACMMWLNVMSFDNWKKLRVIRYDHDVNSKKQHRTTFIRYSVFTWGTSCILPGISATSWSLGSWNSTWKSVELCLIYVPIIGCFVCNICFCTMSALKMKQCKNVMPDTVDEASEQHRKNKQWFNTHLKLFVVMGCHLIPKAVGWLWPNETFVDYALLATSVQSILIFLILPY